MYMLLTFASTHLNGHFQIVFVPMATSRFHSIVMEKVDILQFLLSHWKSFYINV